MSLIGGSKLTDIKFKASMVFSEPICPNGCYLPSVDTGRCLSDEDVDTIEHLSFALRSRALPKAHPGATGNLGPSFGSAGVGAQRRSPPRCRCSRAGWVSSSISRSGIKRTRDKLSKLLKQKLQSGLREAAAVVAFLGVEAGRRARIG
jgi:hypothetical protein